MQFSENTRRVADDVGRCLRALWLYEWLVGSGWQWLPGNPTPIARMVFGGHEAVARPVPIPNTAVKHSLADGSGSIGSARVGRRQFFLKGPEPWFRPLSFGLAVGRREVNSWPTLSGAQSRAGWCQGLHPNAG